jgi:hypothetical protein
MIQLAYKPSQLSGWMGSAIDVMSGFGGISHVELVFSNGDTLRASYGELVTLDPGRDHTGWDMEAIDTTDGEEELIRVWASREVGCHYDKWGVARFVLPWMRQHDDKWFCSEICVAALQRVNRLLFEDAWRVSPNALRKLDKTPQYFTGYPQH